MIPPLLFPVKASVERMAQRFWAEAVSALSRSIDNVSKREMYFIR